MKDIIVELSHHPELKEDVRNDLLNNHEFIKSFSIRQKGLQTLPIWFNSTTQEPDEKILDELWLKTVPSRLKKALNHSNEINQQNVKKIYTNEISNKSQEERQSLRLRKLRESVREHKVVLFLGRQDDMYYQLQQKLNQKYEGIMQFVSDHHWTKCGYTEPGVKTSDNLLSLIQAVETIRRMNILPLQGKALKLRHIAFSLDGYDAKHALSAMYSNPNLRARSHTKFHISGIEKPVFAHTGLTDMELANLVRNPYWFTYVKFYRTGSSGEPEELSEEIVKQQYGIKYMGNLMISAMME